MIVDGVDDVAPDATVRVSVERLRGLAANRTLEATDVDAMPEGDALTVEQKLDKIPNCHP